MSNIIHFERIEAYLDNQLSDEDKTLFEKELQEDAELRRELTLVQNMRKELRLLGEQQLRNKIKKTHEDLQKNHFFKQPTKTITMIINKSMRWISATAAVLLLALGYVFLFDKEKQMTRDEFYATYVQSEYNDLHEYVAKLESQGFAGAGAPDTLKTDSLITSGDEKFARKSFSDAELDFQLAFERDPSKLITRYYLGAAKVNLGKYGEATELLAPFENDNDSLIVNFEMRDYALDEYAKCFDRLKTIEGDKKVLSIWEKIFKDPAHKQYKRNRDRISYLKDRIEKDSAAEK